MENPAHLRADRDAQAQLSLYSQRRFALAAVWLAGVIWISLLIHLAGGVTAPVSAGFTFNEMLVRLLEGRFDVSEDAIGAEAFYYKGVPHAYFGIFCAFLRLPLLLAGTIREVDMTAGSMLAAAVLSLTFRLATVHSIFSDMRARGTPAAFSLVCYAAVAVCGETVQYLKPSIYQEVISWGAALASGFVLVAVRLVLLGQGKERLSYLSLATFAGLGLICKFSFGLGLYSALAMIIAARAWDTFRTTGRVSALTMTIPTTVALGFAAFAGLVNYERWGNPFNFMPMELQLQAHAIFPDRFPRISTQGAFNAKRIPFGIQYYFAPIWELTRSGGHLIFEHAQVKDFEVVELPPSTFFLSDPVTCFFATIGTWVIVFRRRLFTAYLPIVGATMGLALPAAAMLGALAMAFRYRMEFYPVLDFAAAIGLFTVISARGDWCARLMPKLTAATAASALITAGTWLIYNISPFGSATDLDLSRGWAGVYSAPFGGGRIKEIGHLMPDGTRIPRVWPLDEKKRPKF